jgi:hypothetical protein
MYEPLEVVKCKKCRKAIVEPEELIRITKSYYVKDEETKDIVITSKFLV